MKITPDDPRLTAYALDELEEAERKTIELELQDADQWRRETDEITQTAALLIAELAAEPLPELPPGELLAINARLDQEHGRTESFLPHVALEMRFHINPLRRLVRRAMFFASGAAVVAAVCVGAWHFFSGGPGATAFAQTLEQIQKARFIVWTETVCVRESSKEGATWLKPYTKRFAYKAPGLYREELPDGRVRIEDEFNLRGLSLDPNKQEAIFSIVNYPIGEREGPYASVTKLLKGNDLQFVETRNTPKGVVNIFRYSIKAKDGPNGMPWSYDFWIDQKTNQLVEYHLPETDIFDPDTDPARDNPPGKMWTGKPAGMVASGFVFEAKLDDSLFRLDPPAGYTVQTEDTPQVTEQEMIEYLAILAAFNDKIFPEDKEFGGVLSDHTEKLTWNKPKNERPTYGH